jgi:hypothetical protein
MSYLTIERNLGSIAPGHLLPLAAAQHFNSVVPNGSCVFEGAVRKVTKDHLLDLDRRTPFHPQPYRQTPLLRDPSRSGLAIAGLLSREIEIRRRGQRGRHPTRIAEQQVDTLLLALNETDWYEDQREPESFHG